MSLECWPFKEWKLIKWNLSAGLCCRSIRLIPRRSFGFSGKGKTIGRLPDRRFAHRSNCKQLQRIKLSNYEHSWACTECARVQGKITNSLSLAPFDTNNKLIAFSLFKSVCERSGHWCTVQCHKGFDESLQSGRRVPWSNGNSIREWHSWSVRDSKENGKICSRRFR